MGEKGGDTIAQNLFELMWIFIKSTVKTVAKVLVKKHFDKTKATLTSDKRNTKGGKSRGA